MPGQAEAVEAGHACSLGRSCGVVLWPIGAAPGGASGDSGSHVGSEPDSVASTNGLPDQTLGGLGTGAKAGAGATGTGFGPPGA